MTDFILTVVQLQRTWQRSVNSYHQVQGSLLAVVFNDLLNRSEINSNGEFSRFLLSHPVKSGSLSVSSI